MKRKSWIEEDPTSFVVSMAALLALALWMCGCGIPVEEAEPPGQDAARVLVNPPRCPMCADPENPMQFRCCRWDAGVEP